MESDQYFLMPPPPPPHPYAPMDDGQFLLVGHGVVVEEEAVVAVGRSGERKRRFTEEQVRSLESTFHARRAKLEPREKAELARELGLQPRQVAIWFQNKRARWRSKQLEHDYAALRAKYDALHAGLEALKQEKLALASQLQELSEKLKDREDKSGSCNSKGDEKRNISCTLDVDEGVVVPAMGVSMESGYGGLPEPFCATPELWETWPLVEWNAVA